LDQVKDAKRYQQGTQASKPEFYRNFLSAITEKANITLKEHWSLVKFALIFVNMVKHDFPEVWEQAFQGLLSIMTATQDL
jgi:hypothetical protein